MNLLPAFHRFCRAVTVCLLAAALAVSAVPAEARIPVDAVPWARALRQPPAFYRSVEAVRIADNLLLYQHDNGGWEKNIDMATPLDEVRQSAVRDAKKAGQTGIDNGATVTQLLYLARVYDATGTPRFSAGFLRGLDYLLAAQYPNGGWPQFFPLRRGYYSHITFNDNAMAGVLTLLDDIARRGAPFRFVDARRATKAGVAVRRGIDCILRCQVMVKGKPTVWCAQHEARTLAPAPARAYEPVSLSGSESVGITRFLIRIESPSPAVVRAIEGAVTWFRASMLRGIRVVEKPDPKAPGGRDRVVVDDPAAPPIWARFYGIESGAPLFCDRDGVVRSRLLEIGHERRSGYAWMGDWPRKLLETEYPAWKTRVVRTAKTAP